MTVPAADHLRSGSELALWATPHMRRDVWAAADLLDAIAALHQPYTGRISDAPDICGECEEAWPCDTARLLQGEGE